MRVEPGYLACTMPVAITGGPCGEQIHIMWELSEPLHSDDMRVPPVPGDAWVGTWRVECETGHVVLVPADPGCKHSDADAEHPDHGTPGMECDVDPSEELRTFRASDGARLVEVLTALLPEGFTA